MEKLSRRKILGWLGMGGATAAGGAGAVVLSNNAAAAAIDDELRRRVAAMQLGIMTPISETASLNDIGLDWRTEQERLMEETRIASGDWVDDLLLVVQATYTRLEAVGHTFGPRGRPLPFGSLPTSFWPREPEFAKDEEANLMPHFKPLLQELRRGQFSSLIRLTQMFYDEQRREDFVRVETLTRADFADRVWSPRFHVDIGDLSAANLFRIVVVMGMSPVWCWEERLEASLEFAHKLVPVSIGVVDMKDTPLKVDVKQDGPMLTMSAYNEMAGRLKPV